MKDINDFFASVDREKLSYDAVREIQGDISNAYEIMSPEAISLMSRITQGFIKAYLRAYHTWLLQQLSDE